MSYESESNVRRLDCFDVTYDGVIELPLDIIDDLSNEEIGAAIRHLLPRARFAYATALAGQYRGMRVKELAYGGTESLLDLKARIEPYAERSDMIREVLGVTNEAIELLERRRAAKKTRKQMTPSYDRLFVHVGKRDGFYCAKCGGSTDLQLDHVIPVALGGSNKPSNLQLLCGLCNREKGTDTTDYRR